MRRSSRLRAASVHLLSVLAASCSAPSAASAREDDHGTVVERPHLECARAAQTPVPTSAPSTTVSLKAVREDAAGARHYALSDGSEVVLDPLGPFSELSTTTALLQREPCSSPASDSAALLFLVATVVVALSLVLVLARRSAPSP